MSRILSTSETATAADGTHPTGMHSCYLNHVIMFMINLQSNLVLSLSPPYSLGVSFLPQKLGSFLDGAPALGEVVKHVVWNLGLKLHTVFPVVDRFEHVQVPAQSEWKYGN